MKKKIFTIAVSSKDHRVDVCEHGRPRDMDIAEYDGCLLASVSSYIVGKLKSMPVSADQARDLLDKLIGNMNSEFDRLFIHKEDAHE